MPKLQKLQKKNQLNSTNLREGEKVVFDAKPHWSNYLGFNLVIFILGVVGLVGAVISTVPGFIYLILVACLLPFIKTLIEQKNSHYIITDQRVYIEVGFLSKAKVDIALKKINDVTTNQSIMQRMFGSGNIQVLTGNDNPTTIIGIDNPDYFRECLSNLISKH